MSYTELAMVIYLVHTVCVRPHFTFVSIFHIYLQLYEANTIILSIFQMWKLRPAGIQ